VLYNSSLGSELNQTATIIGCGTVGTGLTGASYSNWGNRQGIQNTIDAFGGQLTSNGHNIATITNGQSSDLMFTDFDQPGNPAASIMGGGTPLPLEGCSTAGDSGGGLFLTENGNTYLAGVTDLVGALNTNPLSNASDGHYGDYNTYTRVAVSDTMKFIDSTLVTSNTWTQSGGGVWGAAANWTGSEIPEFAGAAANFAGAITAAANINLDAAWTVGTLTFNNSNSYTLSAVANNSLTLDNGGITSNAAVTDLNGAHTIAAPVILNSTAVVTVVNPNDILTLSGPISGVGGITKSGSGNLILSGANSYAGSTTINSGSLTIASPGALPPGGTVVNNGALFINANTTVGQITGSNGALTIGTSATAAILRLNFASGVPQGPASTVAALVINTGSQLNITNNSLVISYGSTVNDPVAAIRADLAAAYAAGYSGSSLPLTSSTAAASPGKFVLGYSDNTASDQLTVAFTVPGDTNLDGKSSFMDLSTIARNYGATLAKGNPVSWSTGDVNYDGRVDFNDLLLVAQNFGDSLTAQDQNELPSSFVAQYNLALAELAFSPGKSSPVPEPAGAALAVGAAALLARRRRRGQQKSPGLLAGALQSDARSFQ
jgi:autotransporter-associated beta strand protein